MASEFEFGPKMRALNERQRAFVMFMVEFPLASHADAARHAGYSDHAGRAKTTACELLQDKRIVEALNEQAGKRLWAVSLKAAHKVDALISSEDDAVALKASLAILDRTGWAAQQNINVNQVITDQSGKAIMERISALAAKHGLDAQKLLGKPTVEAEVIDG